MTESESPSGRNTAPPVAKARAPRGGPVATGMPVGIAVSVLGHSALMALVLFGGQLFVARDLQSIAVAQVQLLSMSEFGALRSVAPEIRLAALATAPESVPVAEVPVPPAPAESALLRASDNAPPTRPRELAPEAIENPLNVSPAEAATVPEIPAPAPLIAPEPAPAVRPEPPVIAPSPAPPAPVGALREPDPVIVDSNIAPARIDGDIPSPVPLGRAVSPPNAAVDWDTTQAPLQDSTATAPEPASEVEARQPEIDIAPALLVDPPTVPELAPPTVLPDETRSAALQPPADRPPDETEHESAETSTTLDLLSAAVDRLDGGQAGGGRVFRSVEGRLTDRELAYLQDRMARCWNIILISHNRNREDLAVTVAVELKSDGLIKGEPRVIQPEQPTDRQVTAIREAQRAVRQCAPFSGLTPENYASWRHIHFTFDPGGSWRR